MPSWEDGSERYLAEYRGETIYDMGAGAGPLPLEGDMGDDYRFQRFRGEPSRIIETTVTSSPIRSIADIISYAKACAVNESARGIEHAYFTMRDSEREHFDAWLVKINHALAHEAGTTERRFKLFMFDLVSGRYKGEMP